MTRSQFSTSSLMAWRYLLPGVAAMLVFIAFPLLYTVGIGFTNYSSNNLLSEARARLGDAVFGEGEDSYAAAVGRSLRSRGATLAVAESCTGGLIGAMLTSVPGSSDYLLLDAVTYANAAKERVLHVPPEVLMAHGAVSSECVRAMAVNARDVAGADLAIAVSGIAGPSGGTPQKPVGTVFFALATAHGVTARERRFAGDRTSVQRQAAWAALAMVRAACQGPVGSGNASVCG